MTITQLVKSKGTHKIVEHVKCRVNFHWLNAKLEEKYVQKLSLILPLLLCFNQTELNIWSAKAVIYRPTVLLNS